MTQVTGSPAQRFQPYSAYKPSGIDWLGPIPATWDMARLKHRCRFFGGGTPAKDNAGYWSGDIPWVSPKDMKADVVEDSEEHISEEGLRNSATRLVGSGAVLVVVRSGILRRAIPVAINLRPVALNQDMKAVIPDSGLLADYLAFVIRGNQEALLAEWRKAGATVESLEQDLLANQLVPIPPVPEQQAIAAFLHRETAKIDALVEKKERLIELLDEKRAATITRAITQGLDSRSPMKDSGVAEIGQIPAHWEAKRLKHLTPDDRPIMYGIVLPGPNVDDGVPIVKGGDVAPGRLRLDLLNRTTPEIESGYRRSRLKAGDVVYAIRGSIGMAEIVPPEVAGANLTQDAARVAPAHGVSSQWLLFALKSRSVFAQLDSGAVGATIRGINIRDLKRAVIPVPPGGEQVAMASQLLRDSAAFDSLVGKVREAGQRLREYRTALISAAVTGKIDIREIAS